MGPTMRTLGFRTHVLFALAAAAGLVLTLSRPWYGAAPVKAPDKTADIGDINGPLTGFFDGVKRWLTNADGASGWHALDHWALAISAMAAIAALGVVMLIAPAMQQLGRDLVRYAALAAFGIVVWKLLSPPGGHESIELRNGAVAGLAFSLILLVTGSAAASAPLRRKVPQRTFVPPAPPAYESGSSGPPSSF
jgi:hypothetical protein